MVLIFSFIIIISHINHIMILGNRICPIKIISSKAANEAKKNEDNQQIVYKEGIFDSQVHGLSNQKCHILFIGAVGEYVQLTFTKFNLEVGLSDYNVNETKG